MSAVLIWQDVEVSAQYNAKPGINSLRLYCAASEIALEPSFERSTDAYRVKVMCYSHDSTLTSLYTARVRF